MSTDEMSRPDSKQEEKRNADVLARIEKERQIAKQGLARLRERLKTESGRKALPNN